MLIQMMPERWTLGSMPVESSVNDGNDRHHERLAEPGRAALQPGLAPQREPPVERIEERAKEAAADAQEAEDGQLAQVERPAPVLLHKKACTRVYVRGAEGCRARVARFQMHAAICTRSSAH